ncbi:hypothetical protein FRC01_004120 [Tulasnella sp. 417]|nr:hypothetical protein FRC01_004120 [Tulasnella sp. 417]
MGLAPALHQDLMMWYDPLTTLNHNTTTILDITTLSLPALDPTGGGDVLEEPRTSPTADVRTAGLGLGKAYYDEDDEEGGV